MHRSTVETHRLFETAKSTKRLFAAESNGPDGGLLVLSSAPGFCAADSFLGMKMLIADSRCRTGDGVLPSASFATLTGGDGAISRLCAEGSPSSSFPTRFRIHLHSASGFSTQVSGTRVQDLESGVHGPGCKLWDPGSRVRAAGFGTKATGLGQSLEIFCGSGGENRGVRVNCDV